MNQQQNQTTFNNQNTSETFYINYAINNVLLGVNTIFLAKIDTIDNDNNRARIIPIINAVAVNQQTPFPPIIDNVPLGRLIGGNAGFLTKYKVNDIVLCGAVQRDISLIKNNWQTANPASARKFSISDAIVMFNLTNNKPSVFIEVADDGITIEGSSVNITINSDKTIINSNNVEVNADNITLGNAAANNILLENVPMSVTIEGVQSANTPVTTTMTVTAGGSTKVKGAQ